MGMIPRRDGDGGNEESNLIAQRVFDDQTPCCGSSRASKQRAESVGRKIDRLCQGSLTARYCSSKHEKSLMH